MNADKSSGAAWNIFFSACQRLAFLLGLLAERPAGLGTVLHENEASKVVDQTGKEGIVRRAVAQRLPAQFAGKPRSAATVMSEQFHRHFRKVHPQITFEDVHRKDERLDVPGPQLQKRGSSDR